MTDCLCEYISPGAAALHAVFHGVDGPLPKVKNKNCPIHGDAAEIRRIMAGAKQDWEISRYPNWTYEDYMIQAWREIETRGLIHADDISRRFATKPVADGETVCEHMNRPFECSFCRAKINSENETL